MGNKLARATLWAANGLINTALLIVILVLITFGVYAIWDINTVVEKAMPVQYEVYKPVEDGVSFQELQAINPEVTGWLTIYGTNIDYPVVQGEDNAKYLTTDAEGNYSLSGAIFMDYRNDKSFGDFNSIIYGHHMDMNAMFGDVSDFKDRRFFENYKYGNLYFDGMDHGFEIFAFLEVDAYNTRVYMPGIADDEGKLWYTGELHTDAMYQREIGLSTTDRIVLLSTCTADITNGRHILVGRITDEVFPDAFLVEVEQKKKETVDEIQAMQLRDLAPLITLIIIIVLMAIALSALGYRYKDKRNYRNRNRWEKDERQR